MDATVSASGVREEDQAKESAHIATALNINETEKKKKKRKKKVVQLHKQEPLGQVHFEDRVTEEAKNRRKEKKKIK